ncbi:MAG: 16S rRNA (guanine(527)-N(7))-methyltransferase RsmG [Bacteroides sp.]|nr:MAG: 16S rRNA (guanine(527)-N(7))-methyltransferase RsmG [Bacteroides sp.]
MQYILKYFPHISYNQISQFEKMIDIYQYWNSKINLISKKDIDNIYLRHILHSIYICKIINFDTNSQILDLGTGGGFPGIPLAIMNPESKFLLIDSVKKKTLVLKKIVDFLELKNITIINKRIEIGIKNNIYCDFIISRALTNDLKMFIKLSKTFNSNNRNKCLLYFKGGDIIWKKSFNNYIISHKIYSIQNYFHETFFYKKYLIKMIL